MSETPKTPSPEKALKKREQLQGWIEEVAAGRFGKYIKLAAVLSGLGSAGKMYEQGTNLERIGDGISYSVESNYRQTIDDVQRMGGQHESTMPLRVSGFEQAGMRSEDVSDALHTIFPENLLRGQIFEVSMNTHESAMPAGYEENNHRPAVDAAHCHNTPDQPAKIEFGSNMRNAEPKEILDVLVHEVAHKIFDPNASAWLPQAARERINTILFEMVRDNKMTNYAYPNQYRQIAERLFFTTESTEEHMRAAELLAEIISHTVTHRSHMSSNGEIWFQSVRRRWQVDHTIAPEQIEKEIEILRIICEAQGDLAFFARMQRQYKEALERLEEQTAERGIRTRFQQVFQDPRLAALATQEVMRSRKQAEHTYNTPTESNVRDFINEIEGEVTDPSSELTTRERRYLDSEYSPAERDERLHRFNEGILLVRNRYEQHRRRIMETYPDIVALPQESREAIRYTAEFLTTVNAQMRDFRAWNGHDHQIKKGIENLESARLDDITLDHNPYATKINRLTQSNTVLATHIRATIQRLMELDYPEHEESWTTEEREKIEFAEQILRHNEQGTAR